MSKARVVLGSPTWTTYDGHTNSIMVECLVCGIEWGWSTDKRGNGNFDKLQKMADKHNKEVHDEG